ncbi:MAG: sigma-70 family RNA polymerase sigma factor [Clostridia bacterium]|nr:sigma-70 family RNA polymerase sigma factor [Clostridia bacterium]
MEDKRIIELFFARDEAAIEETSAKYGALCRRIAHNILENDLDVEECENDTYLSLWHSIPPKKPQSLPAYITKIVRNHALRRLEYMNAQKRSAVLLPAEELAEIVGETADHSAEELAKLISEFLRAVSEEERRIFVKHYFSLEPLERISAEEGFSVGKIKSMLFRMRNKLRVYLEKEGITL